MVGASTELDERIEDTKWGITGVIQGMYMNLHPAAKPFVKSVLYVQ